MGDFEVVAGSGSFRAASVNAVRFPHRWTEDGVTVECPFTGAHLLHLAAAGCVLNDVYREALSADVTIDGVRVTASGSFDTRTWTSAGITYTVQIDSVASESALAALLHRVDAVAEIPRAIRAGAMVKRARQEAGP